MVENSALVNRPLKSGPTVGEAAACATRMELEPAPQGNCAQDAVRQSDVVFSGHSLFTVVPFL